MNFKRAGFFAICIVLALLIASSVLTAKKIENSKAMAAEKIQETVAFITQKLVETVTSRDKKTAQELRREAAIIGSRMDEESIKNALKTLNISLKHNISRKAFIEMAYCFTSLSALGINAEMNLIRSSGIIDGLHITAEKNRNEYINGISIKIINFVLTGNMGKAVNLYTVLKENVSKTENSKYLQAHFLMEKNWEEKLTISKKLVDLAPQNPAFLNINAIALYKTGAKKQAKKNFKKAVEQNSRYYPAANNLLLLSMNKSPTLQIHAIKKRQWVSEAKDFPYSAFTIMETAFTEDISNPDRKSKFNPVAIITGIFKQPDFTKSIGMEFVKIEPGTFMMGSPFGESGRDDDEKEHSVTLSRGFYMQTTEVTQGQWQAVMGTLPWSGNKYVCDADNNPAVYVSWNDAQEFIKRVNNEEGDSKYRLPTEAEWEYACRAGSKTRFYFGSSDKKIGGYAWYDKNVRDTGEKYAHRVGSKKPNAWGLYDMHGNVWEWCHDWDGEYPSNSVIDPKGPKSGSYRVLRGGSWYDSPSYIRAAGRSGNDPSSRSHNGGFRLVLLPGQ